MKQMKQWKFLLKKIRCSALHRMAVQTVTAWMILDVCDTQFALLGNMTNPLAATVEFYNSWSSWQYDQSKQTTLCAVFEWDLINTSDLDI